MAQKNAQCFLHLSVTLDSSAGRGERIEINRGGKVGEKKRI